MVCHGGLNARFQQSAFDYPFFPLAVNNVKLNFMDLSGIGRSLVSIFCWYAGLNTNWSILLQWQIFKKEKEKNLKNEPIFALVNRVFKKIKLIKLSDKTFGVLKREFGLEWNYT